MLVILVVLMVAIVVMVLMVVVIVVVVCISIGVGVERSKSSGSSSGSQGRRGENQRVARVASRRSGCYPTAAASGWTYKLESSSATPSCRCRRDHRRRMLIGIIIRQAGANPISK